MPTLYVNGRIYAQDLSRPLADAFLVAGGRIQWVGQETEVGTNVAWKRVDLSGATVLPGLRDAHTHMMAYALLKHQVDLRNTRSEAEAARRVAEYAARYPDRPWIRGHGWNEHLWEEGRPPTRASLDQAVPNRPVVLSRVDGHVVWVNSRALELAGVTDETPDPPGGHLERDTQGGLTGLLRETAPRWWINTCHHLPSTSASKPSRPCNTKLTPWDWWKFTQLRAPRPWKRSKCSTQPVV
ncbi:MAG: amidohydrolase family protein [Ardenticatenia bacterium]|nr:amidohydrolase family protein [Ardenticatenia bacterium]